MELSGQFNRQQDILNRLRTTPGTPNPMSQANVDERAWAHAPETRFVDGDHGQMSISDGRTMRPDLWAQTGLLKHSWAQTVPERPKAQGVQEALPFAPSEATTPTDPALHQLRQANPRLLGQLNRPGKGDERQWRNDYQFRAHVVQDGPHAGGGSVAVFHPTDGLVGHFDWNPEAGHEGSAPREIGMIETHPAHQGKGIGEAMYDYARLKGGNPVHSRNRSEEGEAFARRVGGPTLPRTEGLAVDKYAGSIV